MKLKELNMYAAWKLSGECERLCDHMSRRVIGEIQLLILPEFVFLPLTTISFVLPPAAPKEPFRRTSATS